MAPLSPPLTGNAVPTPALAIMATAERAIKDFLIWYFLLRPLDEFETPTIEAWFRMLELSAGSRHGCECLFI